MLEWFFDESRLDEGVVRAPWLRRNADLSRKRPALKAFRVAHFPKALKKNICLFGFAKWYNRAMDDELACSEN